MHENIVSFLEIEDTAQLFFFSLFVELFPAVSPRVLRTALFVPEPFFLFFFCGAFSRVCECERQSEGRKTERQSYSACRVDAGGGDNSQFKLE